MFASVQPDSSGGPAEQNLDIRWKPKCPEEIGYTEMGERLPDSGGKQLPFFQAPRQRQAISSNRQNDGMSIWLGGCLDSPLRCLVISLQPHQGQCARREHAEQQRVERTELA